MCSAIKLHFSSPVPIIKFFADVRKKEQKKGPTPTTTTIFHHIVTLPQNLPISLPQSPHYCLWIERMCLARWDACLKLLLQIWHEWLLWFLWTWVTCRTSPSRKLKLLPHPGSGQTLFFSLRWTELTCLFKLPFFKERRNGRGQKLFSLLFFFPFLAPPVSMGCGLKWIIIVRMRKGRKTYRAP